MYEFDADRFAKKRAELMRLQRIRFKQSTEELCGHDDPTLRRLMHELETIRRELGESEDLST